MASLQFNNKDNRGVVLIELFIAIVLIVTLVTGSLYALFNAVKNAEIGRQRLQAKWFVWDEEEAVRQVRNEAWADLKNGTYYPQYNQTSNPPTSYQGWQLNTGTAIINGFTESVTISSVYRVNENQISDTTGTLDSNMKKVVATVTWESFNTSYTESLSTYISNWKPF